METHTKFEEILDKDGELFFTNVRYSMYPLIRQREDILHIVKSNNGLSFSLNIPTNIDSEENMNDEELDSMFLKALEEINNGESRPIEEVLKSLREDIKHGKV